MIYQSHEEFLAEHALSRTEIDRILRENSRMIERLGERLGGFTEGMAYPSMQSVLFERFGIGVIAVRAVAYQGDRTLEIDVLSYGKDVVYAVEVKSHLREDGIQQMLRILRDFHEFYPGHEDKKVYGILAAVDIPEDLQKRVLTEGIYLARIHDDTFEISVPEGFQPRAY
jgi:hypothetical protein